MTGFLLGCFGGVLWVQQLAALPGWWLLAVSMATAVAVRVRFHGRLLAVVASIGLGLSVGAGYATVRAQWRLDDRLTVALEGQDLRISGVVQGLPEYTEDGARFVFAPDRAALPRQLRLSWYANGQDDIGPPRLTPGDHLDLRVRLRRPTSQFNPGGFDHAGWYLAHGIGAKGHVREGRRVGRASAPSIDLLRDHLREWIGRNADPDVAPLLIAMAVGDQAAITEAQWTALRDTGTAHLVAISGLHVSIIAVLVAGLVGMVWRRVPWLALRLPTGRAAIVAGMCAALLHGALAGYGIPVMRAVVMLSVAAIAAWRTRRPPAGRVLLLALASVLLLDPWAVLSAGFWLSFGAVSALVLVLAGRVGPTGRVLQFVRSQWAIGVLSVPMLLSAFGQISLVAPLANLIAIPIVSLFVVPVLLLASATQCAWLLSVAGFALQRLMALLSHMAGWPMASWSGAVPPTVLLCFAALGAFLLLLPRGTPMRLSGLGMLLVTLVWSPARPVDGAFDARVFDVGQGLAVRIRTRTHVLMYDAGRSYYRGGDAGRSVVLPALRHEGIDRLDRLVLSHDDSDHTGGAGSLLAGLSVAHITASAGVHVPDRVLDACVAGDAWEWDGVRFGWLSPTADAHEDDDNNRSCVLQVRGRSGSLLLTGDIQRQAEAGLVARGVSPLSVVVAPHHGSKSSSSEALIDAAQAQHVVFSAGLGNVYGHPAPVVVSRWLHAGAQAWNTADGGLIDIHWDGEVPVVAGYAQTHQRYWHRLRP
jgi:competence protein ComEC